MGTKHEVEWALAAIIPREPKGTAHRAPVRRLSLAAVLVGCLAGNAIAATFVVNTVTDASDAMPGDGVCATSGGACSLRAAIQEANALAGADAVTLPAGVYTLVIAGTGEDAATTGDLDVTDALSIAGAGSGSTIIDGAAVDRVFDVPGNGTLMLTDITVQHGGTTPASNFGGGGLRVATNAGTAALTRCQVKQNSAAAGSGIFSFGALTLTDTQIVDNHNSGVAGNYGAGLSNFGGVATLVRSLIAENEDSPGAQAGSVFVLGAVGTASNRARLEIVNGSTGDQIFLDQADVEARNATVIGITAGGSGGTIQAANSIFAGAFACTGGFLSLSSAGFNVFKGVTDCSVATGDVVADPLLGPLQDNGGFTRTYDLLAGSPAREAGNPTSPGSGANSCELVDQRGVVRPRGPRCDAGAVEADSLLAQGAKMYWAEAYAHRIARSNLDGSNVETIVSGITPLRLTVDQPNGKIWWTDIAVASNARIRRANLDGSNVEDVVALGNVTPSAVRLSGGKLYWSEYLPVNRVLRSNLDGSNVEEILAGLDANVYGVATAPGLGKIYWSSALGDTVNRANLDGTGQETLVTGTDGANGIVVSVPLGKIYWTATGGTVNRANLDGTNVETLESGIGNLEDLDLDLANGHVYWANSTYPGRIQRANLDGSGLVTLVTDLTSPFGVVLADVTSPCGDGIVQGAEQCDRGAANGSDTSCCTMQCELRTAGETCRTGNGVCDPAEVCTGTAGTCPADQLAADGTACDDGLFCNGADSCGSGSCSAHGGNPCTGDCTSTCVEDGDQCTDPAGTPCGSDGTLCTADRCDGAGNCQHLAEPDPACVLPAARGKASLKIKNPPGGVAGDSFKFKWGGGPAVAASDFGSPPSGTPSLELCIYDRYAGTTAQVFRARAPASGLCGSVPCWKAISTVGWKFTSKDGMPDGITGLLLKSGGAGRATIQVKGKGTQLALPNLPLQQSPSVVAQLRTSNGKCWGANFAPPSVNTLLQFSGKSN